MKHPVLVLFAALLVLAAPSGFAGGCLQRNPPGSTEGDASSPCGCPAGGDSVGADCIMVNLEMGATTPWTGSRPLALKVFADSDSPLVFTPDSLYPIMGYAFKRLGNAVMTGEGLTPVNMSQ